MTEQFIGCTVSIEVGGGLGFYQGKVESINLGSQTVTLSKVLHNGKPNQAKEVTISGTDIISLKILYTKTGEKLPQTLSRESKEVSQIDESQRSLSGENSGIQLLLSGSECRSPAKVPEENSVSKATQEGFNVYQEKLNEPSNKFDTAPVSKRKLRTSVGESLAHSSMHPQRVSGSDVSSPYQRHISGNEFGNQRSGYDSFHFRRNQDPVSRVPIKRQLWKTYRDESTFGNPIDEDILNTEFDFERNLALFDKQAVIEEIQSLKPDVVRQADKKTERNYRCDQNILTCKSQTERKIIVPASDAGEIVYATDNGLLVPSVSGELRLNLLSTANQHGLTKSRQLEMMGRGATEIILSVIGGSHRLEPGNSHQPPVVVILCGAHMQGAAGVNCGRQLECQGVQTVLVTPPLCASPPPSLLLSNEMQLYNLTSGRATTDINSLPATVDLIVDARLDIAGQLGVSARLWLSATTSWASASRAPVIALDPPSDLTISDPPNEPLVPRIKLCPALPLAYVSGKGKVYLINLNVPLQVFSSLNIKYTSPFGAKLVIPLHPCE